MDGAKSDSVPHKREHRLVFSRAMQTEDSLFQSNLRIYDNRKEPVDVIYQFMLMNSTMEHFDLMSVLVLLHICEVLPCQRLFPLVFTNVLSDKDGTDLGSLDTIRDEEHIGVINRFIQASGLFAVYGDENSIYRYNVM